MLDALTITEAEAAGLSELAALDLAMARDFASRAQAAEDPDTANDLARSYQRVARSYRQSLALKVRLRRELVAAEREAARPPSPPAEAAVRARVEAVRQSVRRVIWDEHEAAEVGDGEDDDERAGEAFYNALDGWAAAVDAELTRRARAEGFAAEPLDAQVLAVCTALGLDEGRARRWRELPEAPWEALSGAPPDIDPDPPPRRTSG